MALVEYKYGWVEQNGVEVIQFFYTWDNATTDDPEMGPVDSGRGVNTSANLSASIRMDRLATGQVFNDTLAANTTKTWRVPNAWKPITMQDLRFTMQVNFVAMASAKRVEEGTTLHIQHPGEEVVVTELD